MNDTRSRTLRSKLVDLSVAIARSPDAAIDLEDELDRTIGELEAHEGRSICLKDELDAAPPAQVIALVEPIRDRLQCALRRVHDANDQAVLRAALMAVEAKIEAAVRCLLSDKRAVS